jgi:hypothetical protein
MDEVAASLLFCMVQTATPPQLSRPTTLVFTFSPSLNRSLTKVGEKYFLGYMILRRVGKKYYFLGINDFKKVGKKLIFWDI